MRVNSEKSKAIGSRAISKRKKEKFTIISYIQFIANLGKYLGFPLLTNRATKNDFAFINEKIQARLAG